MAAYNKTIGTEVIPWTTVATANVLIGNAIDVTSKIMARFHVSIGRAAASAWTAGWPLVRVDVAGVVSGNADWFPALVWNPFVGSSLAGTVLNGAVAAGATSVVLTSASNVSVGDFLFVGHPTDSTKYEIARVRSVVSTTVSLHEPLSYDHPTGALVTDQAEMQSADLSLDAVGRIRVVVDNAGGGQSVIVRVCMSTLDSVS